VSIEKQTKKPWTSPLDPARKRGTSAEKSVCCGFPMLSNLAEELKAGELQAGPFGF
jgi:hypothetical protein